MGTERSAVTVSVQSVLTIGGEGAGIVRNSDSDFLLSLHIWCYFLYRGKKRSTVLDTKW